MPLTDDATAQGREQWTRAADVQYLRLSCLPNRAMPLAFDWPAVDSNSIPVKHSFFTFPQRFDALTRGQQSVFAHGRNY